MDREHGDNNRNLGSAISLLMHPRGWDMDGQVNKECAGCADGPLASISPSSVFSCAAGAGKLKLCIF